LGGEHDGRKGKEERERFELLCSVLSFDSITQSAIAFLYFCIRPQIIPHPIASILEEIELENSL
jgi:hypothetical protein